MNWLTLPVGEREPRREEDRCTVMQVFGQWMRQFRWDQVISVIILPKATVKLVWFMADEDRVENEVPTHPFCWCTDLAESGTCLTPFCLLPLSTRSSFGSSYLIFWQWVDSRKKRKGEEVCNRLLWKASQKPYISAAYVWVLKVFVLLELINVDLKWPYFQLQSCSQ